MHLYLRAFRLCSSIAAVLSLLASAYADSPQTVDLGYATYRGTFSSTSDITSFFGIRYASPPTGKLRFQAPELPKRVRGVQSADIQPAICNQGSSGSAPLSPFRISKRQAPTQSEDCLFVNVFVPGRVNPRARLPVVFWIHGGGYVAGSGGDGSDLIRDAGGGVISVMVQYRLGAFGFLSGNEVKRKGALNAGLLDQRFALEWVQQHIRSFGGDPTKVTIWGESAGAGSVLQHMLADGGNTQPPLFRAGITSSLFLPSQFNFNDRIPERLYTEIVERTGCANARAAFQCISSVDVGVLEAANRAVCAGVFSGTFAFTPVVDGKLIQERPIEAISRGRLNGEMLYVITNTFEGRIFVNAGITSSMTLSEYFAQLFPDLSPSQIRTGARLYSNAGLNGVVDQATGVMGESIFICPSYFLLGAFSGRAYKAEFAVPPGDHGNDVAYYFPGANGPPFNNPQFVTSFAGSFLSVVKSLDPNENQLPENITPQWALFSRSRSPTARGIEMLFNRTEADLPDIRVIRTDRQLLERCSFWLDVAPTTSQ